MSQRLLVKRNDRAPYSTVVNGNRMRSTGEAFLKACMRGEHARYLEYASTLGFFMDVDYDVLGSWMRHQSIGGFPAIDRWWQRIWDEARASRDETARLPANAPRLTDVPWHCPALFNRLAAYCAADDGGSPIYPNKDILDEINFVAKATTERELGVFEKLQPGHHTLLSYPPPGWASPAVTAEGDFE